jgi:regulator of sigma E protease
VKVPGALDRLADVAVYEPGVAALTPDATQGSLLVRAGIEPADLYVFDVPEGSPEHKADLRAGDRIIAVDNQEVLAWLTFEELLHAAPDRPHTVSFERQGERKVGVMQLRRELYIDEYSRERSRYELRARNWAPLVPDPPVESPHAVRYAFISAVEETYDAARFILVGIVRIAEGKIGISTLGGPITVYDVVGEESAKGVSYFVWAMAIISINLGLINLLPIPVLDGGHLLFFGFEAILRRPLPLRVREIASLLGMLVLVGLMVIAVKNDVERRWDVIRAQVDELVP